MSKLMIKCTFVLPFINGLCLIPARHYKGRTIWSPVSPLRRLLLALALGSAALHAQAAEPELLNVSYDVARELYKDVNPAFIAEWKKTSGETVVDQAVARRLEQAGARRRRRPRSLGRDHEPGQRHRHAGRPRPGRQGLGQEIPEQCRAVLLDHGVPGPQGQSEADPRLGRPGQAGCESRDPEPEDRRQRPLHLPGGLGLGDQERRQRSPGARAGRRASSRTCRCWTPAAAPPPPPSPSARSATPW
jgi:hypothetical protein